VTNSADAETRQLSSIVGTCKGLLPAGVVAHIEEMARSDQCAVAWKRYPDCPGGNAHVPSFGFAFTYRIAWLRSEGRAGMLASADRGPACQRNSTLYGAEEGTKTRPAAWLRPSGVKLTGLPESVPADAPIR